MRITNIKNEDEPEKLQVFHRIKQTHVKCTARPHGKKNGIFEVQSDFTLHGSIFLCKKECVTIDHSLRRFAVNLSIAKRILEIRKLIFHMARFPLFTQANYIE